MIGYHHVLMIALTFPITMLCEIVPTTTWVVKPIYYFGHLVNTISTMFSAVLLSGCTSNGMSNIYLLSLQYNNPESPIVTAPGQVSPAIANAVFNASQTGNGTALEVRAGYMGLCIGKTGPDLDETRVCSSSAKSLAGFVQAEKKTIDLGNVSITIIPDPLNLIMIAEEFRQKIVFDGLM